jgi:hypothetical protein
VRRSDVRPTGEQREIDATDLDALSQDGPDGDPVTATADLLDRVMAEDDANDPYLADYRCP